MLRGSNRPRRETPSGRHRAAAPTRGQSSCIQCDVLGSLCAEERMHRGTTAREALRLTDWTVASAGFVIMTPMSSGKFGENLISDEHLSAQRGSGAQAGRPVKGGVSRMQKEGEGIGGRVGQRKCYRELQRAQLRGDADVKGVGVSKGGRVARATGMCGYEGEGCQMDRAAGEQRGVADLFSTLSSSSQ